MRKFTVMVLLWFIFQVKCVPWETGVWSRPGMWTGRVYAVVTSQYYATLYRLITADLRHKRKVGRGLWLVVSTREMFPSGAVQCLCLVAACTCEGHHSVKNFSHIAPPPTRGPHRILPSLSLDGGEMFYWFISGRRWECEEERRAPDQWLRLRSEAVCCLWQNSPDLNGQHYLCSYSVNISPQTSQIFPL